MVAKLWITYAWIDDDDDDVQYIASQLSKRIDVKIDKWALRAGDRLWLQIENFICDPSQCDAWAIYATEASLKSQACREELYIALDRALKQRNANFPLIGIFPGPISDDLIPAAIKTRLYVSTTDSDWEERVIAASLGRIPDIPKAQMQPYSHKLHQFADGNILEVRPRAASWYPMLVAVPIEEKHHISRVMQGPRNDISPFPRIIRGRGPAADSSGKYWIWILDEVITPAISCYIYLNGAPSSIIFGPETGTQHEISLRLV